MKTDQPKDLIELIKSGCAVCGGGPATTMTHGHFIDLPYGFEDSYGFNHCQHHTEEELTEVINQMKKLRITGEL